MTTIDPAEEQRRRKASYRGSGKALTWTVLAGLLIAAAGALAGLGIAGFMEQFRIMAFQSIGETNAWFPESIPPWLPTVGDFGSIFLSIAAVALYLQWNRRYTGRTEGVGGAGPTLLWLVGCAVSLWFACLLLWGGGAGHRRLLRRPLPCRGRVGCRCLDHVLGEDLVAARRDTDRPTGVPHPQSGQPGTAVEEPSDRPDAVHPDPGEGHRHRGRGAQPGGLEDLHEMDVHLPRPPRSAAVGEAFGVYGSSSYPGQGNTVWVIFPATEPDNTRRMYVSMKDSRNPADYQSVSHA